MRYAGIDYSTKAIDIVTIDVDTLAPTWHHYPLLGHDAFERTRFVPRAMPAPGNELWDDVLGIGIEDPAQRGKMNHTLTAKLRPVMGAILACLPPATMVKPYRPGEWRKANGLPGNCTKEEVAEWSRAAMYQVDGVNRIWPQDAHDAYCLGRATMLQAEVVGVLL